MKTLLSLLLILSSSLALAETNDLDDLQTIDLQLEESSTPAYTVQYPGYRIGGGTPPRLNITDCLLLDIKDSDNLITTEKKLALAKKLVVIDGFQRAPDSTPVLTPTVQGKNVVFNLQSNGGYMTILQVKTKTGKSLAATINTEAPVGLVYIRACRF